MKTVETLASVSSVPDAFRIFAHFGFSDAVCSVSDAAEIPFLDCELLEDDAAPSSPVNPQFLVWGLGII